MKEWKLVDVITRLQKAFPDVMFHSHHQRSTMRPDGGILFLKPRDTSDDRMFPVLITEVKNQGTNDLRVAEGLKKQAKGNAIERLGKNVVGFRTAMLSEQIIPFVCFGDGCDFAEDSSILDRVTTIAMFGPLNRTVVVAEGPEGVFNRGSFYFRDRQWTADEMKQIMVDVAGRSIYYYFAKYGEQFFEMV